MTNHQHPISNFTDKLMELMPDGVPDDTIREAVAMVELVAAAGGTPDQAADYIKINTERQYRLELDTGVSLDARKQNRDTWNIVMASPTSPGGRSIRQTYVQAGEKMEALLGMMQLASDYGLVKSRLMGFVNEFWERGGPEAFGPVRDTLLDDEDAFDSLYRFSKKVNERGFLLDFDYLGIKSSDLSGFSAWRFEGVAGHTEFLATIALHEIWIEQYRKTFKEELEMAHSEGRGPIWWRMYGSQKNVNRVKNSLTHNNHMVVLDSETQIFLRIQDSEKKFVEGLAGTNQLRAKMVDEPEWGTTVCGKKHVSLIAHERRCNSCRREKSNLARAAETAAQQAAAAVEVVEPVQTGKVGQSNGVQKVTGKGAQSGLQAVPSGMAQKEEKQWQARNGPVITVQGPQEVAEDDYEAQAKENRRVADDLLAKAAYYENLAEHFEALCQPTTAVQEAEASMAEAVRKAQAIIDAAKAKEEADRIAQKDRLDALVASGPPA